MIQEFKDFVSKGNVIDLAVAVVLGAAFAPVVGAVVDRILMPIIGMIVGQPNFDTLGTFACDAESTAEGLINGCAGSVGALITALVNFLLVGLALFIVVKLYNNATSEPEVDEPEAPADPDDVVLLREIRDALTTR